MRIIIFWFWVLVTGSLAAQSDSLRSSVMASDSISPSVPAWYQATVAPADSSLVDRARGFFRTELAPELGEDPEKDRLTLTIKIPWREDFLIPYFPRGLLPADPDSEYGPEIAWQRSAIVPGLGQIYNRSGWKVPIFWLGYGAGAWWINYNQSQYKRFQTAYLLAVDDDPLTNDSELSELYDAEGMRSARNQFREARDNGVLILLGWHGLQIMEAFVDAHLQEFDVSNDLSLRWRPVADVSGLGLSILF